MVLASLTSMYSSFPSKMVARLSNTLRVQSLWRRLVRSSVELDWHHHDHVTEKPFSLTKLTYANHIFRFPAHLSSYPADELDSILSTAFLSLLDLCISTIRHNPEHPPGRPSYNVLMTLEHMHLIPRRKDAYVWAEGGQTLNINALGFAGMLMVRSDEELKALHNESIGKILLSVGLESVHDLQVAELSIEGDR